MITTCLEKLIEETTDRELAEAAQAELDCLRAEYESALETADEAQSQAAAEQHRASRAESEARSAVYQARQERDEREAEDWERQRAVSDLERAQSRGDEYGERAALRRLNRGF